MFVVSTDRNRLIALVKNWPRIQQRFHRAEDILDHPQLFVLQRHLTRREIYVRRQYRSESSHRTCEKLAAYPAAISSSGRHPRPSTIVCTSAPPHAEGDLCSSSVPTCRRSALPP